MMKSMTCSSPEDVLPLSSCHWQALKAHRHRNDEDSEDHGRGSGIPVPKSRHRHSISCVGGYLYLFCGKDGTSPLKDMWRFHIKTQRWEVVETRGSSLPFLQGHTSVAYRRLVVIFGGTFSDNLGDVQLWTYNTDLGHLREIWIEPGAVQPLCRRDHSSVVHNNIMYVYGGFEDSSGANQELWAYNIDEEEWTELTTLSRSQPGRRYGHSAVVADNAMWLYGGMAGLTPRADLWRYSLLLHQWKKVKALGSPPSLSGHTACVVHQQMIVIGGTCQGKPVNDVWCFRFDTSIWQRIFSCGISTLPRMSFHAAVAWCPGMPGSHQPANRTRSTPHLKGQARRTLTVDQFTVRPRSSPCVAHGNRVAGHAHSTDTAYREARGTQVLTLTDEKVEMTDLGRGDRRSGTNSCNKADNRIHVNLRECLVSSSPDAPGFYDSCLPVSKAGLAHSSSLEEDTPFQTLDPKGAGCLHLLPSSFSAPEDLSVHCLTTNLQGSRPDLIDLGSEGSKPDLLDLEGEGSKPDLIDLSDSPVLRASTRQKLEGGGQPNPFRNDLFVEDLETDGDGGLDKLKISYPSKNPFLPLSYSACEEGGSGTNSASWILDRQERNWSFSHSESRQLDLDPGSQVIELRSLGRADEDARVGPQTGLSQLCAKAREEDGGEPSEATPSSGFKTSLTVEKRAQGESRIHGENKVHAENGILGENKVHAENMFLGENRIHDENIVCAENRAHVESRVHNENRVYGGNRAHVDSRNHIENRIHGENRVHCETRICVNSDVPRRQEDLYTDEEEGSMRAMVEEPFLLVLGGRMEEHGSVHAKPLPVWKGVFL